MRHDPGKACLYSALNLIIIRLSVHTSGMHLEPFSNEGWVGFHRAVHCMSVHDSDVFESFAGMAERGFSTTRTAGAGSGPIVHCMRLCAASKNKCLSLM